MSHRDNMANLIRPEITIRQLDAAGREVSCQVGTNHLTYAAMNNLMNAWLRSGPSQVTHIYARFGDDADSPGYLAPPGNDIRAVTREHFLNSEDSVRGGLWVPILAAPVQDTTDAGRYVGNRATFFFQIPGNLSADNISPAGNFNLETSWIHAVGLAVAHNTSNRQYDQIVTVMQAYGYDDGSPSLGDFAPFQLIEGGQTTFSYQIPLKFD